MRRHSVESLGQSPQIQRSPDSIVELCVRSPIAFNVMQHSEVTQQPVCSPDTAGHDPSASCAVCKKSRAR
jgi:hypothetical protein